MNIRVEGFQRCFRGGTGVGLDVRGKGEDYVIDYP